RPLVPCEFDLDPLGVVAVVAVEELGERRQRLGEDRGLGRRLDLQLQLRRVLDPAVQAQPLTTPIGLSLATRLASPAWATTSTTRSTSLYANGASSARPVGDGQRTTIPCGSSSRRSSLPPICLRAAVRESVRPA